VAWQADTSLEAVILYFATAQVGAIFTPLNPRATGPETAALLAQCDPALVLGDEQRGHMSLARLADIARGQPPRARPEVQDGDAHVIFFTSGTTGAPKGCVLSQRAQLLRAGPGAPWPAADTVCMFPQFHMANWLKSLETWVGGAHVVLVERPDADALIDAIERNRAAKLYCIPAVWRRILEADRSARDLSSLRVAETGTSSTSAQFLHELRDAFPGAQVSVVYGSTEAGVVCMLRPEIIDSKPGSVGPAFLDNEIRLGGDGGMMVRNSWLFSGYFRNPVATAAALVDGWYLSGDIALCDHDRCYHIVGRANDLIRTGGESVAPIEVEAAIQTHPDVAEVAVAGMPDEIWGEVITAFVVPRDGGTLELGQLREHCANILAKHKRPRRLILVDQLPRTSATGQIQRKALRQQASASESTTC
jgi:acyl-CoA synthetase (AMP-forming)/AMP-acid ligase II